MTTRDLPLRAAATPWQVRLSPRRAGRSGRIRGRLWTPVIAALEPREVVV